MSEGYAAPPPPPESPPARVRPTTVTVASLLLLVVAVTYVVGFVMAISVIGTMTEIFEEEFAGTEAEGAAGFATVFAFGPAVINLLIAIGIVILAIFNNRGSNPARIVTWVLGGIGLCCNGLGLLLTNVSMGAGGDTGGVDQERLEQRIEDALPSWYGGAEVAILAISILALIVALILLALPPSNAFFRKPPPQFEPPPGYPPPPSYPQVG